MASGEVDAGEADDLQSSIDAANSNMPAARARRWPGQEVEPAAGMTTNDDMQAQPERPSVVSTVDAKAIRAGLGMSQPAFAEAFGLKLAVLRDWEQGRFKPDGASRVLLRVIAVRPDMVKAIVSAYGVPVAS